MANKETYLGEFEQIVLLALLHLKENAYGMTIRMEINERIGRDVSIGAVYTTLERLEKKGFIVSKMGETTPQRGGKAKRYFHITPNGKGKLNEARKNFEIMWQGLGPELLGMEGVYV